MAIGSFGYQQGSYAAVYVSGPAWVEPVPPPPAPVSTGPLHQPVHGQVLTVFRGAIKDGRVFWKSGPREVNGGVFADFAVAIARNEFQKPGILLHVEADGIPIIDQSTDSALGGGGFTFRIYDGIDNDFEPVMVATDGAGQTPAYHGLIYLFFEDFDCGPYGNRIPIISAEWTDTGTSAGTTSILPLIATDPPYNFNTTNTLLCYDGGFNRFYTYYIHDDDITRLTLGITDFNADAETSLAVLTGKPDAGIYNLFGACAIPKAGWFLCNSNNNLSQYWYLLVDPERGLVIDSLATGGEVVEWIGAQSLSGGNKSIYIAAGRTIGTSFDMPVAFMEVNVTDGSITHIDPGRDGVGDGSLTHVTTGFANSGGTVFYVAQSTGKVFEARFTEASPPVYTEVYDAGAGTIVGLYYDSGFAAIILSVVDGSTRKARRIDPGSGAVAWDVVVPGNATAGYTVMPAGGAYTSLFDHLINVGTHRLRPGSALVVDQNNFVAGSFLGLMSLINGSIIDLGQIGAWADHFDHYTGKIYKSYDPVVQNWRTAATANYNLGEITIAEILTDFSTYDGLLDPSEVTTEGLAGLTTLGVRIDRTSDLRDLAARICELYQIDRIDTGTGVKFIKKATDALLTPDAIIAEADLVETRSGDITALVSSRRKSETETPSEVSVSFIDANADFNGSSISASRPIGVFASTRSTLSKTLAVPLVSTTQVIKELATVLLYSLVRGQTVHNLTVSRRHLAVEPSDVVDVTADGLVRTLKVERVVKRPDNAQEITAEEYLTAVDTTVVAGTTVVNGVNGQNGPAVAAPSPARYIHLDTALQRFADDLGGDGVISYAVITSRGQDSWPGGSLLRRDDGVWDEVARIAGPIPTVGVLQAALDAPPVTFETDRVNTLTIRILAGTAADLISTTHAAMIGGTNRAAVGRPGRWMILGWQTVTDNGDGTYTLDTLLQGTKGTETYEGTSQAGDWFVVLQPDYVLPVSYDTADVDAAFSYRAVGKNVDPSTVVIESHVVSGAAETPRAPGSPEAVTSGSDIVLSAKRRSRLLVPSGGTFGDGSSGALGSDLDVYQFEVLDGPGGTVLRTYSDVAGPQQTYTAAQITTDFGSMPDNLTFRVAQKSSIAGIGYGYVAERSIALQ